MDTVAIVLTVLVGTAGYVLQAYSARRAENSSAMEVHNLHVHELQRQREHEYHLTADPHPCNLKLIIFPSQYS